MTVRFLKSPGGKNALGASFLLVSQKGKKIRTTTPMTNMAIMLALRH
jgi:hypothetical protein